MIETGHVRGKLVLKVADFRVGARLCGPNSDNGNLILKWWRVQ